MFFCFVLIVHTFLKDIEDSYVKPSRKRHSRTSNMEQEKYFEKYAKIVGDSSGLDAAKLTKSNKSYGMGKSRLQAKCVSVQ